MADETDIIDTTPDIPADRDPLDQAFVIPQDDDADADADAPTEVESDTPDAPEELPVTREQFTQMLDVMRQQQQELAAMKSPQQPQTPGLSLKERLIKNRNFADADAAMIADALEEAMGDMDARFLPKQYEGALAQTFLHSRQQQAMDKLRGRYKPEESDISGINDAAQKVQEEFGHSLPAELAMEVALLRKQQARKQTPAKPAMKKPFAPTHTGAPAGRAARIPDEQWDQMTDQERALAFLEGRN
jgi:hypothetical protein